RRARALRDVPGQARLGSLARADAAHAPLGEPPVRPQAAAPDGAPVLASARIAPRGEAPVSGIALGLGLALVASLALNGSYVIQHVGSASAPPVDARRPLFTVWSLLRSRWWALGAALGMAGWAVHVAALSNAPLSLVQAFVAGGPAPLAPGAARGLGSPFTGPGTLGVAAAVGPARLPCGGP